MTRGILEIFEGVWQMVGDWTAAGEEGVWPGCGLRSRSQSQSRATPGCGTHCSVL